MPKKSTKLESDLLQILPQRPEPETVPEPAELPPEPQLETPEAPETASNEPAAPKKVVAVVPRKVAEAAALGIELKEPDPEVEVPPGTIFQAVGVISGAIAFTEEEEGKVSASITLQGKQYPLLYAPPRRRAFEALKKEVEATGEATQRLVVYPKFTHFPSRDQDYAVAFQLVGFDKGRQSEVISEQLQDLEFQLCGLWQFIPVCRTPCISVFKNFTKERLDFIKEIPTTKKVGYMKASHLPLFWRDAPVQPFRYNPRATKDEQGKPVFVQIKAKFSPRRDAFEFESLLGLPLERGPKFLKASKTDKAAAMAEKKTRKMEREAAERAAEREARRVASGASTKPKPKPKPRSES